MPRSLSLSLTCALVLVLAGCDRQSDTPAQPQENSAAQNGSESGGELTGTVDRSFAGTAMPATALTDPSGAKLTLAELKGKPVLVNLWATWCAPCVTEMPLLDALAGELGDAVHVITISEDLTGAEAVEPFFAEKKFAHLTKWMDQENALPPAFGGASLPLTVLYDAEGKEVWRVVGGFDWGGAAAREAVAEASTT
jgi:thiol-disulfide isomerase/thioredoxin